MNLKTAVRLAVGIALGTALASAGVTYTCDPSVAAATCIYLNTTVAGHYSSTFTNANASIYITYGTTGLASSTSFPNFITYNQYVTALTNNAHKSAIQISALSALNSYDASPYSSGDVKIAAALGVALGFTGLNGIEADASTECTIGNAGCYNAVVTVTNDPATPLYYDNLGGPEPSDAYDFYASVEHETDEVLGTASCIATNNVSLADNCGDGTPSVVDLFRYSGTGALVLDSSLSTAPGAYFSYNGGVTNGANGVGGSPKFYNALANGDDYGDFVSSSPDCATNQAIQDAEGCPGADKGLNILNDDGGEINILNALGYNRQIAGVDLFDSISNSLFSGNPGSCPTNWICSGSPAPGFASYAPTTAQYPGGSPFLTSAFSPTVYGGSGIIRQLTSLTWMGGTTYVLNLWAGLPITEPDGTTLVGGWPGGSNGAVRLYLTMGNGFGQVAAFDIPSPGRGVFALNPITFTLPTNSGAIGQQIGVMIYVSAPSLFSSNFAIAP